MKIYKDEVTKLIMIFMKKKGINLIEKEKQNLIEKRGENGF